MKGAPEGLVWGKGGIDIGITFGGNSTLGLG